MSRKNKGKTVSRTIVGFTSLLFAIIVIGTITVYITTQYYVNKIDILDPVAIETIPVSDYSQDNEAASKEIQSEIMKEIELMTKEGGETLSPSEASSVYEELSSIAEEVAGGEEQTPLPISSNSNVTNILLIGTDTRAGAGWVGNSDSMILCSINHEKRTIYLTSIMRDTFVNIAGVGGSKLNRAHALGGGELLVSTIEQNFRIHIDYYARVDFYAMIDIINSLGGIPLTISDAEVKVANYYINEMATGVGLDPNNYLLSSGGTYILNGMQAVAYSRIRYVGNADFGRTQRQRTVLTTIFNQLKSSDLGTINNFLNTSLPKITTNMPSDVISSFISNATVYLNFGFRADLRIPVDGIGYYSVNEMLVTDFNATNQWLTSIIY